MGTPTLPPSAREHPKRRCCCLAAGIVGLGLLLCVGCLEGAICWFMPPHTARGWIDDQRRTPPAWQVTVPEDNARDSYRGLLPVSITSESEADLVWDWPEKSLEGDPSAESDLPSARAEVASRKFLLTKLHEGAPRRYARGSHEFSLGEDHELLELLRASRIAALAATVAHAEGHDDEALATLEDAAFLGANLVNGEEVEQASTGWSIVSIEHMVAMPIILCGRASDGALLAHIDRVREARGRMCEVTTLLAGCAAGMDAEVDSGLRYGFWVLSRVGDDAPATRMTGLTRHVLKVDASRLWLRDRLARGIEELEKPLASRDLAAFDERAKRDMDAREDRIAVWFMPNLGGLCAGRHGRGAAPRGGGGVRP
jgi:hypothetical protein